MANDDWNILADQHILHHWINEEDPDEEAWVHPDFYQENGTPMTSDGDDMIYVATHIKKP